MKTIQSLRSMISSDRRRYPKEDKLIAEKSVTSSVGQLFLLVVKTVGFFVLPNNEQHYLIPCLITLSMIGLRLVLSFRFKAWGNELALWRKLMACAILGTALGWGLLGATALFASGVRSEMGILVLLIVGGISAAATTTIVPWKGIARVFIGITLGIPSVTIIYNAQGSADFLVGATFVLYFGLLYMQIGSHTRSFSDLSDRQNQLEAIALSSMEAIAITSEGLIIDINPAFERIFGCTKQQALGRSIISFMKVDESYEQLAAKVMHDNSVREYIGVRFDGSEFPMQGHGRFLELAGKRCRVSCIRDISDRKAYEEALIENARTAKEASRLKSEFLANMSHEIRTPLNGVIGLTDLLLEMPSTDLQRKYLRTMKESGESLLYIINDILDFSKIESGRIELESVKFSLPSALEAQIDLLASRAKEKNLALTLTVDPRLPENVIGDPGRIGQVLLNLVGNAIKFTHKGHISVRAQLDDLSEQTAVVTFSVSDTGIGIASHTLQKLFTPFSQADASTARQYGGTGLGLSISHQLVKLLGGRIWVESREGLGSSFRFTLPMKLAAKETLAERKRNQASHVSSIEVLFIADDSLALETACTYAAAWGWRASSWHLSNGASLVKKIKESKERYSVIAIGSSLLNDEVMRAFNTDQSIFHYANRKLIVLGAMNGSELELSRQFKGKMGFASYPVRQSELHDAIVTTYQSNQSADASHAVPAYAVLQTAPGSQNIKRVLVAEDNSTNQLLIKAMLQSLGYHFQLAKNGREALALYESTSFDLILMDCQMPELDGFATTAAIRERESGTNKRIPIIALTANAMKEDREKCLASGMDDYIAKPVKKDLLQSTVATWLDPNRALNDRSTKVS